MPSLTPKNTPTASDLVIGSVSVGGKLIVVAATASPGTLIHTVPSSGLQFQRIVIFAVNSDTVQRELVIEWGAAGAANQIPTQLGARRGLVPVIEDLKLAAASEVRAFCTTANVIRVYVAVGEITQGPSSSVAGGP